VSLFAAVLCGLCCANTSIFRWSSSTRTTLTDSNCKNSAKSCKWDPVWHQGSVYSGIHFKDGGIGPNVLIHLFFSTKPLNSFINENLTRLGEFMENVSDMPKELQRDYENTIPISLSNDAQKQAMILVLQCVKSLLPRIEANFNNPEKVIDFSHFITMLAPTNLLLRSQICALKQLLREVD
jgi:hypothetical protein